MNPSAIDKILERARVQSSDRILEIGPGLGLMTERLAQKAARVVAVEKDRRFAQVLLERLGGLKNCAIVEGDILNLELPKILPQDHGKWKVVANLPYNIATEVIFHLFDSGYLFSSFHLMVQREVANRLVARPGSKDYGILSVFSQLFSENRIVMTLKPGAFTPPPKVQSAVVEFKLAEGCRYSIHYLPTFEEVVRTAFGQRRKMIRNSLLSGLGQYPPEKIKKALQEVGIRPTMRAETVSIDQFAKLANELT